ncbi:hypothetical protein [Lysobacter humi (ex Lee et al. 2017)]
MKRSSLVGSVAASVLVLGAALTFTVSASTNITRPASSICKAAFGAGASVFYFDAEFAQNTSTGTQYLSCSVDDIHDTTSVQSPTNLNLHFQNPNASAATVTCVVVLTHPGLSRSVASYTINVPANTGSAHSFSDIGPGSTPALPARTESLDMYTMSCAIPAGVKFNNISVQSPRNMAA